MGCWPAGTAAHRQAHQVTKPSSMSCSVGVSILRYASCLAQGGSRCHHAAIVLFCTAWLDLCQGGRVALTPALALPLGASGEVAPARPMPRKHCAHRRLGGHHSRGRRERRQTLQGGGCHTQVRWRVRLARASLLLPGFARWHTHRSIPAAQFLGQMLFGIPYGAFARQGVDWPNVAVCSHDII